MLASRTESPNCILETTQRMMVPVMAAIRNGAFAGKNVSIAFPEGNAHVWLDCKAQPKVRLVKTRPNVSVPAKNRLSCSLSKQDIVAPSIAKRAQGNSGYVPVNIRCLKMISKLGEWILVLQRPSP